MDYIKIAAIVLGIGTLGYLKRHGFRRTWYVLRTGEENPDFEKLGAEYFWGKKAKREANVPDQK
jgi:hypothetical protein